MLAILFILVLMTCSYESQNLLTSQDICIFHEHLKVVSCKVIFSFINLYLSKRWSTSSEEVGFECFFNVLYFEEIP